MNAVNGCTSANFPAEAVAQGLVFIPIMWNIYFPDLLQIISVNSYSDDCTLSGTHTRKQTQDVIEFVRRQLRDIKAYGDRWQVTFAAEQTQAMMSSRSVRKQGNFMGS